MLFCWLPRIYGDIQLAVLGRGAGFFFFVWLWGFFKQYRYAEGKGGREGSLRTLTKVQRNGTE